MYTKINSGEKKVECSIESDIVMTRDVYNRMLLYARAAEGEVSGFCEVERKDGDFILTSCMILEQECTGTTTDLDMDAVGKFFNQLLVDGVDQTKFRCWWHSHANMKVFYSGTDVETANGLLKDWGDYFVGITINKEGEIYSRLAFLNPVPITIIEPLTYVIDEVPAELETAIKEEVKAKVKEKVWGGTWKDTQRDKDSYRQTAGFDFPGTEGVWDRRIGKYRHKWTGEIWDSMLKRYVIADTNQMGCDLCDETKELLVWDSIEQMWLCSTCEYKLSKKVSKQIGYSAEDISSGDYY